MKLVFGRDVEVAAWVGERVGTRFFPPYVTIGFTSDGQTLFCGTVFNNWNGHNIEVSLATDRGLTRGILRAIHYYVFEQSGATRLTAHTARSNKRLRKILPRIGFQFEGVSPRWYGPERKHDAFRFGLMKENMRFL